MKKFFSIFAIAALLGATVLTSCDKDNDDSDNNPTPSNQVAVESNITSNTTWTADKTYILAGRIAVTSGFTLTIEAGTVIKGEAGTGANATALVVAQGGKIMAEGTAEKPIIFTSVADKITSGEIASPNMDPSLNGLWGGVIILGKAPISADAASVQIEGIPASDANGLYGGDDAADNSGVFKYVSIRHGGANIGEGNEINGLTLGGVGSGTIIEYIEIVANQDDGVEWFGGSVNLSNVIVWNIGDDAIDVDQAWEGTLNNFIVINPGDEGMELDGGEGSFNKTHTITNGTISAMNAEGLVDLDDKTAPANTDVNMSNIYFVNIKAGQDFDDNPSSLVASNLQVETLPTVDADGNTAVYTLADFFKKGTDANVTEVSSPTVGADVSKFTNWSWAQVNGELSNF